MNKKFVAVIGNGDSGKSTVIQSLTGCPTRSYCGRVTDTVTGNEIEVIAASPQEKRISEAQLLNIFRTAARRLSSAGAVVAIRPSRSYKRQTMEHIFSLATRAGLSPYAFVLSPPHKGHSRPVDVSSIRRRLASSHVPVHTIDAKRFAHINASIIRDTAGLF